MTTDERLLNCTSSESPNKSSGDIVERLRSHVNDRGGPAKDDDGNYVGTVWPMMLESAAEIERLRRENKQCLALLEQQAIQITDGRTIYDSANRRALTAESAVAAAWEGIDKLEGGHLLLLAAVKASDPLDEIVWRIQEELSIIARMRSTKPDRSPGKQIKKARRVFLTRGQ